MFFPPRILLCFEQFIPLLYPFLILFQKVLSGGSLDPPHGGFSGRCCRNPVFFQVGVFVPLGFPKLAPPPQRVDIMSISAPLHFPFSFLGVLHRKPSLSVWSSVYGSPNPPGTGHVLDCHPNGTVCPCAVLSFPSPAF